MQEIIEYELGQIVTIDFSTHAANGQPVAPSAAYSSNAVDFRIYKEDSATQKATLNGLACISPFDSIVGKHVITIDTANSTGDSGFWESGKNYRVELHTVKTIDGVEQKGVVVGRFKLTPSTLTATTLRAALGMSAANLDTQLSGLPAAIEAAILNEGDATALLAAISAKVEEFLINDGDATATLSAIATACATAILSTPANKLATNGSGEVTAANFIAAPTVADIADGVWDELLAGHATSGSSGKILTDLSTGSIDLSALATLVAAALAQIRLSVQQQLTLTSGSDLRVIQGDDYTRAGSKIVIGGS